MLPPVNLIDTMRGRYLLFASRDMISLNLYLCNQWEPVTLAIAKSFLAAAGDGVVIDAGANLGAFSIPLARELPRTLTFHCFEVQRIVYYQLCANVFVNGLQNVHPHLTGLGDAAGRADVPVPDYVRDTNNGGVSLSREVRSLRHHQLTDTDCTTFEVVAVQTLDAYQFPKVRLLKIDVEGMELAVLQGAEKTLAANSYPPVLFEMWNEAAFPAFAGQHQRLIDYLAGIGYAVQRLGDLGIAQYAARPRMLFQVDAEKDILGSYWVDP